MKEKISKYIEENNEKSANTREWIMGLMDDYKQEPGKKQIVTHTKTGKARKKNTLEETNAKGINNDYCKFIRLGHNFVNKTEEGVMAYICGNTFTKTNIFRGMRYELLKDFDEIYIINLHGSSKFDESTENVKDENVFNIMVGVSINIFVKRKNPQSEGLAKVFYKDVYGTRKEKLDFLSSHRFEDIEFEEVIPDAPFYELTPKSENYNDLKDEYLQGFKFDELLTVKVQGFKTEKDNVAIQNSTNDVKSLIRNWINDTKYFDLVPQTAWDIYISGYQPLDKWLKDRTNKSLSGDDIRHFQKIVVALAKTSALMNQIDQTIIVNLDHSH